MNPFVTKLLEGIPVYVLLPMVSSFSPVLANNYMNPFETTLLEGIPVDLSPLLKADHRVRYGFKPRASIG